MEAYYWFQPTEPSSPTLLSVQDVPKVAKDTADGVCYRVSSEVYIVRETDASMSEGVARVCVCYRLMLNGIVGPGVQRDGAGITSRPAVSAEFIRFRITRVKRKNLIKSRSPSRPPPSPSFVARSLRHFFFRRLVSMYVMFHRKAPARYTDANITAYRYTSRENW